MDQTHVEASRFGYGRLRFDGFDLNVVSRRSSAADDATGSHVLAKDSLKSGHAIV